GWTRQSNRLERPTISDTDLGEHSSMGTQSSPIRTLPSAPEFHRILRHPSLAGYHRRSGIGAERLTLPRSLAALIIVLHPLAVNHGCGLSTKKTNAPSNWMGPARMARECRFQDGRGA